MRTLPKGEILWLSVVVALVFIYSLRPSTYLADGREYLSTATAFLNRGTPQIQESDIWQARDELRETGFSGWLMCIERGREGALYPYHFWLYPFLLAPFKAMAAASGNIYNAGLFFNITLFSLVIFAHCRLPAEDKMRRWFFLALAISGPCVTYMLSIGTEIMTWACAVLGLLLLEKKRYAYAVLSFAVASTQNPAMIFAALPPLFLSGRQDRKSFVSGIMFSGLALVPSLWTLWAFGVPSLLKRDGLISPGGITAARISSLFLDLNQGIAMFTPILFLLFIFSGATAWRHRDTLAWAYALIVIIMAAACVSHLNLNSGALGVIRYGVWMIPFMAWVTARNLPTSEAGRAAVAISVATASILMLLAQSNSTSWTAPARLVLDHAPQFYNPPAEIFIERTTGVENSTTHKAAHHPLIIYRSRATGRISKIGVYGQEGLRRLAALHLLTPHDTSQILAQNDSRTEWFYINFPEKSR